MRGLVLGVWLLSGCDAVLGLDERAPVTTDLVAWYPMDEVAGNLLEDATGNGNAGSCQPSCPIATAGIRDGALAFDGSQLIAISTAPLLRTDAGFTVAAWVRIDAEIPGVYACAASKSFGADIRNSWQLCFEGNRRIHFHTSNPADLVKSPQSLELATWYHLAIRWNASTLEKDLAIDGIVVSGATNVSTELDFGPLSIGGDVDTGARVVMLPGSIDDVRIFDAALSNAELAALALR